MKNLNESFVATAVNGGQINVKLVPLQRQQSTPNGFIMVDVGQMVELETGETFPLNVDGKSFYTGINRLYRF
ncbi:transposase [Acinetobacter sp. ANC 5054]|uniref:transposase n=1 Tax=Acinetobacter sp. ANC 5054 TaxID=1977877 RepID=UPI000A34FD21|nr:transposase [Acinetobacter sp. ANC 5054]OTG82621.1 transposase [Acinetobacter sp. ANC 5054]